MRFEIWRTSECYNEKLPVEGAVLVESEFVREYNYYHNSYEIEVNSLEELVGLVKKVGHSIVIHEGEFGELPSLEIHDEIE